MLIPAFQVVTGATGSLGAHLVSQLVVQQDVQRIYCLVRASSPSAAQLRVTHSMQDRSVYDQLQPEQQAKIVALPSDFSKADLGLSPWMYRQIQSEVSGLIHCAWSVNFNLGLGSFEADCIAGMEQVAFRSKPHY